MNGSNGTASGGIRFSPDLLLRGSVVLALCWWFSVQALAGSLWLVVLALLACTLTLALGLLHQATVRRILRRSQYRRQGLLFRLFSGRTLDLVVALCAGFPASVFLLLRLHVFDSGQWLLAALSLICFLLLYLLLQRRLAGQYKTFALSHAALRWTRLLCPLLPAALALLWQYADPPAAAADFPALLQAHRQQVEDLQGSVALHELALLLQSWEATREAALLGTGDKPALMLLATLLENWLLFYLLGSLFAAVALSGTELRRCLQPLSDATTPPPLGAARLALLSAIVSFILAFILLPLSAYVELWAREREARIVEADRQLTLHLEQIGSHWYRPGTWDSLQQLRAGLLQELELDEAALRRGIDEAFEGMEGNVDLFLDWYYSLGGEYARLAQLMGGNLENYLARKLNESLQQGDLFAPVQSRLDQALARQRDLEQEYLQQAAQVLEANQVEPGDHGIEPLRQLTMNDVMTPPVHQDLLQLQTRLIASTAGGAGAGLMTSVIAAKLSSRMLAKGGFKLAAKALGKLLASKAGGSAAGAGAGAAAGAAAGSVVPGVGTAIGAVLGGIAGGVMAGLAIDKAMIEFEEYLNREQFRSELLLALEEARMEFHGGLR